jgi:hypothetical protein
MLEERAIYNMGMLRSEAVLDHAQNWQEFN